MTTFRPGQLVCIRWPNGSAVEGPVSATYVDSIAVGPADYATYYDLGWSGDDGRTVTVLSEPRPEEPQGLGAVVEAYLLADGPKCRALWVSNASRDPEIGRWHGPAGGSWRWSELIDPVVLHEGMTP